MARRKKVGYGDESIAPEGSDDGLDLSDYGLEDHNSEPILDKKGKRVGTTINPTKKKAKRVAKGKKRSETKVCPACKDGYHDPDDCPNPPWEEPAVEVKAARAFGIDTSMECPVCRSLEECECEEDDRTFARRVRFEDDVKKTARCPRCKAPLSVVYLPRPGAKPPFRLSQFEALWSCSCCHTEAVACAVLAVKGPF